MPRSGPRYSEEEAREAVAKSLSYAETLRRLGMCSSGGGGRILRKYVEIWGISTTHFDPWAANRCAQRCKVVPLPEILVQGSTFSRGHLKRRLFDEGVKARACELCGQGEVWRGRRMGLILDHISGVRDDHRLENLRIVCPNCAATLDTHCGRQNRLLLEPVPCLLCGKPFQPRYRRHRYCSRYCGTRAKGYGRPYPERRKVPRPPYTHLLREVRAIGYLATGRRYGVSDNAIRKWLRQYERELAREKRETQGDEGGDPGGGSDPTRPGDDHQGDANLANAA